MPNGCAGLATLKVSFTSGCTLTLNKCYMWLKLNCRIISFNIFLYKIKKDLFKALVILIDLKLLN